MAETGYAVDPERPDARPGHDPHPAAPACGRRRGGDVEAERRSSRGLGHLQTGDPPGIQGRRTDLPGVAGKPERVLWPSGNHPLDPGQRGGDHPPGRRPGKERPPTVRFWRGSAWTGDGPGWTGPGRARPPWPIPPGSCWCPVPPDTPSRLPPWNWSRTASSPSTTPGIRAGRAGPSRAFSGGWCGRADSISNPGGATSLSPSFERWVKSKLGGRMSWFFSSKGGRSFRSFFAPAA